MVRVNVLGESPRSGGVGRAAPAARRSLPAAAHGRTTLQSYTEHVAGFDIDGADIVKPGNPGTAGFRSGSRAVASRRRPATLWNG